MACFKFCQLSIEIVLLASRLLRDYHNFPVPADLDAGDVHTRCSNAFDGPSQVSLAEGGWPASHCKLSRLSPSGPNAGLWKRRSMVTAPVAFSIAAVSSVSASTDLPCSDHTSPMWS
jgi:hypothetical protein